MYTNDVFVMKIEHTIPSSVWQGSTIDLIHCWFLNIFVMECFESSDIFEMIFCV